MFNTEMYLTLLVISVDVILFVFHYGYVVYNTINVFH
jgi:hypothetical protein